MSDVSEATFHPELGRPAVILLVEDSPSDVTMTMAALSACHIVNEIHLARDGEEAIAFLRRTGPHRGAPRPDLIFLDLNLPKKDGREVLAEVKADPDLRSVPVIVLTSSVAPNDIARAYDLHANAYVAKPVTFDGFLATIRGIEDFWLGVARLPGS